jgi:hypothetical protein
LARKPELEKFKYITSESGKMGSDKLFFYSIIGFCAGIYFFFKGFHWLNEKRLIQNTPTSKIRSMAIGPVEINGEVVPPKGEILKSPFSVSDCVYYRYTIEEYRRSGKSSRWVTVKKGEERIKFYVRDDTGTVLINSQGAEMDIPKDNEYDSSFLRHPPQAVENFLSSIGLRSEGFLGFEKKMRFREYFLAPKDNIYVFGTAAQNPYIHNSAVDCENLIVQKGKNLKFYYISDSSEKDILNKLKWKVIGGLYGGAALTCICLMIIFGYLNIL